MTMIDARLLDPNGSEISPNLSFLTNCSEVSVVTVTASRSQIHRLIRETSLRQVKLTDP